MKNLIYVSMTFFISIIFSCTINYQEKLNVPEFNNIEESYKWIKYNIKYEDDIVQFGKNNYWQYPEETLNNKKGDCEDRAILLLKICEQQFNIKGELVAFSKNDNEGHMTVKINNNYYGTVKEYNIEKEHYNYDISMSMAYNNFGY
jgi:hypothetical protein